MAIPDDRDYYDEPYVCTGNWRSCPCYQCEEKREERSEMKYQRQRDKEFDDE